MTLPNGIVKEKWDFRSTLSNGIIENEREIRDSGITLPNGIIDFQNWILILATIDLLILFKNEGLSRNTFDFLL